MKKFRLSKRQKEQVEEVKRQLKEEWGNKWALMRLDLMEDYNPQEIAELLQQNDLKESLLRTQESQDDEFYKLLGQGTYLIPEILEILRENLLSRYIREPAQEEELSPMKRYVEETLEKALRNRRKKMQEPTTGV